MRTGWSPPPTAVSREGPGSPGNPLGWFLPALRTCPLMPFPSFFLFVSPPPGSPSLPGEGLPWSGGQAAPSQVGPPAGFKPQPRGSYLPAPRPPCILSSLSRGCHIRPPASQVLILRCAANSGPAGLPGSRGKLATGGTAQWIPSFKLQPTPHPCEHAHKDTQTLARVCAPTHMRTPRPTYPPPAGTSLFSGSLQNL